VLHICTLASATSRARIPREVNKFAQKRQLRVYALRDGSSSFCFGEEDVYWLEGDDCGVRKVGGGVCRRLVIDPEENLFSGSSSLSESLSLESLDRKGRGDER
jgi:hypothetical protein